MTHSTRSQSRPALSVRTRASIHKTHAQMVSRHGFPWKRIQMQLRNRITSSETPNPELSDTLTDMPPDSQKLQSHDSQSNTPSILTGSDELPAMTRETMNYPSSSSSTTSSDSAAGSACKWEGCGITIESSQLITHIQQVHVIPQFVSCRRKCFSCLWRGCRVFRQPSVSAAWLEQHILHHTDAKGKPFRCIFDSCTLRFSTSILLERHVQRCHIRATRAHAVSHTCNDSITVDEPSMTEVLHSAIASHSPLEASKTSTVPSTNVRKCCKRRRKLRCYRVRRVDFYDNRSRCVIQHRLKILSLLSRCGFMSLDNGLTNQQTVSQPNLTETGQLTLPKPLYNTSPSKPRLRSSVQPGQTVSRAVQKSSKTSVDSRGHLERLRNVALLLTMPHTCIGQRLSEDGNTEFLIRWLGGAGMTQLPPMWISEEHLKAARALSEL